jgi:hypothetical protein
MRNIFTFCLLLASVNVFGQLSLTFDGNINEPDWQSALATSSGGPNPGFGAGHEINAIYVIGDTQNINIAVAGNVQNDNRILVFIDSKTGGYNNGNFGRSNAPQGIDDFNSGTIFDTGFSPEYCLVIGTDAMRSDFYFDLYTLSGTATPVSGGGSNLYLGSAFSSATDEIGASPANSSNGDGFEVAISKSALGYTGGSIQVMAMYTSDAGSLSNQFLTRANFGEGNYGNGSVDFSAAAPGSVSVSSSALPVTLTHFTATPKSSTVQLDWATATELNNDGFEVQRSADARSWEKLGWVAGRGTTQERQDYGFVDEAPLSGQSYYRLKQIDYDGQYEYSPTVSVRGRGEALFSVFPNPARERLQVRFDDTPPVDARLRLRNARGQTVREWPVDTRGGLSLEGIRPGAYVLQLEGVRVGSLHAERVMVQ